MFESAVAPSRMNQMLPATTFCRLLLLMTLIFAVAFRIFIGVCFFLPDLDGRGSDYWAIATNLAAGNGYSAEEGPTAILTPAFPLALALFRICFGPSPILLVALQSLVCLATAFLIFRVGKMIFSDAAGLIACALYAANPYLAKFDVSVIEGCVFPLSLALLVFLLLRCAERNRWIDYVLTGAALGFAYLARPTVGLFAPFAALWLWWIAGRFRLAAISRIAVMTLVCMAVVSPWPIRNALVFHRLILSRANGGQNLWFGNNEYTDQVYPEYSLDCLMPVLNAKWRESGVRTTAENLPFDRDNYFLRLGKQYIRENPGVFFRRALVKTLELYHWELSPRYANYENVRYVAGKLIIDPPVKRRFIEEAAYSIPYIFIIIFACAGLTGSWTRRRKILLLLALILANSATYAIFFGTTKNRAPLDPFLMVMAGQGVVMVWAWLGSRLRGRADAA